MGDVEIENFEITDWDIANEFNVDRIRRRPTKNQQIYGIWADDESDNEGGRPSFQSSRKAKDFTAPINFVSGGVRQVGKKEEEKKEESGDERGSSSEEEVVRIPAKSKRTAFRGGRGGAGGVAHGLLGSSGDFGHWEKHTKGIGAKLLLQMGYQPGKGLGRDLQGISAPVEAKVRKGKGAIGLYGPEKVGPTLVGATSKDDSAAGSRAAQRGDLNQWRKRKEGEKKVTYVYKTVDEVKSEGVYRKAPAPQSKLSKVKVIDMTGPEQRVLSGYHELHHQPTRPIEEREDETAAKRGPVGSNFSVSELIHNLDLLVDMTEQRIMRNDREAKYEEDRTVNLQHELERLDDLTRAEEAQAHRLAKVSDILSQLEERTKEGCSDFLTLSEIASLFQTLQDEFYEDYKMFALSDLAFTDRKSVV